jgi:uncharacterized protein DUF3352
MSADPSPRRAAPWWLVGGAVVLVLALVVGVTYAVRTLSGGGTQPEEALPSGAFAFAKLDLDPAAGQKIDAVRFLRKFPALREKIGKDADLRKVLFEAVRDQAGLQDVDYTRNVAPWLGHRAALAAYPPAKQGDGPRVVVALQVRDQGTARDGLARITRAYGAAAPGFAVGGGYALLAPTQPAADRAAKDAATAPLAAARDFGADMDRLADGVAAAWVDMGRAAQALGRLGALGGLGLFGSVDGLATAGGSGRASFVLRFDGGDALEVTGTVSGSRAVVPVSHRVTGLGELPGSSLVALGLADGEKLAPALFASLRGAPGGEDGFDEAVAGLETQLGIDLPQDLAVLLGSNLVAALDAGSPGGELELGARAATDPAAARSVLDKLEAAAGQEFPIVRRQTADGVIVASTEAQADRLAGRGHLGEKAAFRKALPDLGSASFALWVDVRGLAKDFLDEAGAVDANLEPLDGVGMTAVLEGAGSASYRIRLVAH